ncbi:hypothetical protein R5H30_13465 [Sulfitobacter sp. D35]|uniref:hypothetical protein n=1 Tax=Sulfitobacter sp. D35 TaxID=3083252 RepID=UPI00296E6A61|nr:hypothetical protein [Sulfitobacter sp. D35]MDW4498998.1 hypothetical protein [Sulfitobacter sp. D35]
MSEKLDMGSRNQLRDVGALFDRWWIAFAALLVACILIAVARFEALSGVMIVLSGIAGAVAGIGLQAPHVERNPFWVRRRIFGLPRGSSIHVTGIAAMLGALGLFVAGLSEAAAGPWTVMCFLAGANGLFYFGIGYWISGKIALGRARDRLRRADTLQQHVWREAYEADGPAFSRPDSRPVTRRVDPVPDAETDRDARSKPPNGSSPHTAKRLGRSRAA